MSFDLVLLLVVIVPCSVVVMTGFSQFEFVAGFKTLVPFRCMAFMLEMSSCSLGEADLLCWAGLFSTRGSSFSEGELNRLFISFHKPFRLCIPLLGLKFVLIQVLTFSCFVHLHRITCCLPTGQNISRGQA